MRIVWFQLGERDYVAVTPQDISAWEQRFRTDTAEECGVRRRSCCVCAGARGSGPKEPSPSPTCPTVTAKQEALEGRPCSSRQWTQVFIHTRDSGSPVFLLGLEREGVSSAEDCHTLVEATLNFLFTHYVNFGNTPVNGSKYTHWEPLWLNLFLVLICWDSGTVWCHLYFKFLFSSHF